MVILSDEYLDYLLASDRFWAHMTVPELFVKLMEEVGEASQALIGAAGLNPHKGRIGREADVAHELADVAVNAMVLMIKLGFSPDDMLKWQQEKVKEKLRALA